MLPSRAIIRSLPSAGAQGQKLSAAIPRTALGNGRRYGTVSQTLGRSIGGGSGSGSSSRIGLNLYPRMSRPAMAVGMGTVASTRNLSLPSFWSSKKPVQEEAAAAANSTAAPGQQATTTTTPSPVAESAPVEAVTATPPIDIAASSAAATPGPEQLSVIGDLVNSSGSEILSRAEDIGYLASLGLDYGFGPTSAMQWVLEHVHVWGGVGWAGAIVSTAMILRVAMFYPTVKSTRFSADMKRMQEDPRFPQTTEMLKLAIRDGDRTAQAQAQALNGILRKEYDVPMRRMLWSFLPIPFSYGLFRIVTGMTHIPVPSLETGGWLWFTDLTVADPYMVLPAMATVLMVAAIDINAANSPKSQQGMVKMMKYILVPVMLFGTSFLSAAVNLMGVSFGFATLINTVILNNNAVRRSLGIPELHRAQKLPASIPTTALAGSAGSATSAQKLIYEPPRPQQAISLREQFSRQLDDARKAATEKMSNLTGQAGVSAQDKAEKKRKEQLRNLEAKRRAQEREHFESKYKGKR
ncbi:YidC/Oxa1 family membrane protein insertase [Geosmithia morbida]|uniref:YidC/Oxa1 family membrane protein insertase n=1 Tax=Geosmithia morbida TaxID=1094350 RepID=A0A9P5D2E3_9HYPO|nr:YidC/Oxa1 family membrane protein insertase [Geosmithia morbida]KAF4120725.1 YidC/Oxa1 family membrane protein insertase [Geosmithia morbida]